MRILIAVAAMTCFAAQVAQAADLDLGPLRGTGYNSYGADLAPVADWSGVYVGGFGGYGQRTFEKNRLQLKRSTGTVTDIDFSQKDAQDTAFGGFAGYNYQIDEIVLGAEVDYTSAGLRGTSSSIPFEDKKIEATTKLSDFGTVRVRAGYTLGPLMPFVTVGVAIGSLTTTAQLKDGIANPDPVNLPLSKNTVSVGYTAGAGVDYMLTQNVFLRGEYQYAFFDDFNGRKYNVNVVRGGAGVKF